MYKKKIGAKYQQRFPKTYKYLYEVKKMRKYYSHHFNLFDLLRYYPKWLNNLKPGKSPLNDQRAWVVFSALEFMEKILNKNMICFEYGSGGSSVFLAKRIKKIISVEHEKEWLERVENRIKELGYTNWEGNIVEPSDDIDYKQKKITKVDDYISSLQVYENKSFQKYASFIDKYPDDYFDVVMIDGRVRHSCFVHAKSKIKKGGYLILDNSERENYRIIHDNLNNKNWIKYNFYGPGPYVFFEFWQTTIWKRIQ